MRAIPVAVWLVPVAGLLVALAPLPYGYYMLLRLVVCASAAYLAYSAWKSGSRSWVWLLALLALLYNPVLRIHLTREIWQVINVLTIAAYLAHFWIGRRHKPTASEIQKKRIGTNGRA